MLLHKITYNTDVFTDKAYQFSNRHLLEIDLLWWNGRRNWENLIEFENTEETKKKQTFLESSLELFQ
jgi:hypothetical protein